MARELLSLKGTSSTPLEAGQVKLYWQGILWIIQLSLSNAFNFPQTLFFICFHWKVFKANTITIDNEKALVLTFAFYFLTSSPLKDDDFVHDDDNDNDNENYDDDDHGDDDDDDNDRPFYH